jgi:hypothetical protein
MSVACGSIARAVVIACLSWRAAPRPEPVLPEPQPRLGDHRRRGRRAQRGDQRRQPFAQQRAPGDLGVPERGALFVVPVHRAQQRVDVQKHPLVGARQQRGALRERDQMRASHRGELVGMPEAELAQQDPHRRGRVHLAEHPRRAAGAQQVRIIDAVRAAHHASDEGGQLPGRVNRPGPHPRAGQVDVLADQPRKTGLLSQFQHQNQTRGRHQILLVEDRRPDGERMR